MIGQLQQRIRNFRLPSRRRFNQVMSNGLVMCVLFYYMFHLISGNKGLLALLHLEQHVETTRVEQQETRAKRERLEQRVQGLYEETLDVDMLDEQARKSLGKTGKNEVMVIPKHKPVAPSR